MPAEPEPPELAALVDFAERGRVGDWSLRGALVRYAQGEPRRVRLVLELVRRLDAALHPHSSALVKDGPAIWAAVTADGAATGAHAPLVELLRTAQVLDALGDTLATWAEDPKAAPRPDAEVDAAIAAVTARLADLGVPEEEPIPRGARRRG